MPAVVYGIMAVPARKEPAWRLEAQISKQDAHAFVSFDMHKRGPWWNWQATACQGLESHVLANYVAVLQDDVTLCPEFHETVLRLLAQVPPKHELSPLVLFTARKSIAKEAAQRGVSLLQRIGLDTAQALVFPRHTLQAFLAWSRSVVAPATWGQHDDSWLDGWSRATRTRFVYALPTLVDHDVQLKSTMGHSGKTRFGLRVSPYMMGEGGPSFDWSAK